MKERKIRGNTKVPTMRKIGATALLSDHCKNRHLEIGPRILELQSFARNCRRYCQMLCIGDGRILVEMIDLVI
jgi:hypothetical protein